MLTLTKRQAGVTMIELMIGLTVLGLLIGMGVPTFRSWMQNAEIRTTADGLLNGIQLARTEAIRRNSAVQFTLQAHGNWTVVDRSGEAVQEKKGATGSNNVDVKVIAPGGAETITFLPLGAPSTDGAAAIREIEVTSSKSVSGLRPLHIVISMSGSVRLCDPDTNLPARDPRRCEL